MSSVSMERTATNLKAERVKLMERADSLAVASRRDSSLISDFDQILRDITALDKQIVQVETQEQQAAQRAGREFDGSSSTRVVHDNSTIFADLARGMKHSNAADVPEHIRAITSTSGAAAIQDPMVVDEIIYALQANNELVEAGMQIVNIENYKVMPKVTAYPTVQWQDGEGTQISLDSALTIGSVKWELKDAAIRVRVSNQFLMDSSERGKRMLQESMRRAIQAGLAQTVFTGTGANGQPRGIENFPGVQTVDASTQLLSSWEEIISACKKLAQANVPISKISAFFSPTVWAQIASFEATGDGQPLLKPELLKPVSFRNPTNYIPESYDSDTTTRAFFGDFSSLVVGVQGSFEFVLDQVRADYLETDFLIHLRMDVQASHENNFAYIDNISLT